MKKEKAIMFAVLSSVMYGMQTVTISFDLHLGNTADVSLAMRGAIGMLLLYTMLRMKGKSVLIPKDKVVPMLLLSLLGGSATNLCLTTAYQYLPVGLVTTLHYLYPFAIITVNLVLFHKKIRRLALIACGISLAGVALMADYSGSIRFLGVLMSLASVCAWSFYIIYYEHSGLSEVADEAVVFYNCCCQLLLGVGTSVISGGYAGVTGSMLAHIFLSFVGIGLGIAAQVMLQTAIVNIGSGLSGIMGVLEPVSSLLLGGLLLKDVLTPRQMIAAAVTLAGITLVLISENAKEPAVKGNS